MSHSAKHAKTESSAGSERPAPAASSESQPSSSAATSGKAAASSQKQQGGGKLHNKQQERQRRRLQFLLSHLNEEQLERYEQFRRGAFTKASVRRVMSGVCGTTVSQNCVIGMCGIAKIFITDVIETACAVREEQKEEAQPLKPKHIREALRRLNEHTPANRKRQTYRTLFN